MKLSLALIFVLMSLNAFALSSPEELTSECLDGSEKQSLSCLKALKEKMLVIRDECTNFENDEANKSELQKNNGLALERKKIQCARESASKVTREACLMDEVIRQTKEICSQNEEEDEEE